MCEFRESRVVAGFKSDANRADNIALNFTLNQQGSEEDEVGEEEAAEVGRMINCAFANLPPPPLPPPFNR